MTRCVVPRAGLFLCLASLGLVVSLACSPVAKAPAADLSNLPLQNPAGLHLWLAAPASGQTDLPPGSPDRPDEIFVAGRIDLGEGWTGLLLRQNGDPAFDRMLMLSVHRTDPEDQSRAAATGSPAPDEAPEPEPLILAGLQAGDSGGWYCEAWFLDHRTRGLPDILVRESGFQTPNQRNGLAETDEWDHFELLTWDGQHYESQTLAPSPSLAAGYPFSGNPL
jgi:hypothetical protein